DAEHGVAEGPQLRVDERLIAAIAAPPLDRIPIGFGRAAVTPGSAIQEDLDILFGRELTSEVLAQADLVASHDEVMPSHHCHPASFYETRVRVKIGGAVQGPFGPASPSWKAGADCRVSPGPARRRNRPLYAANRRTRRSAEPSGLTEMAQRSERHPRPGGPRPGPCGPSSRPRRRFRAQRASRTSSSSAVAGGREKTTRMCPAAGGAPPESRAPSNTM